MIVSTARVEDFDRFLGVFSTKAAEIRKRHGSKGSSVFRDPEESDRVWVVFDWSPEDYASFVADPEMRAVFQEAGLKGPPQAAEFAGEFDS